MGFANFNAEMAKKHMAPMVKAAMKQLKKMAIKKAILVGGWSSREMTNRGTEPGIREERNVSFKSEEKVYLLGYTVLKNAKQQLISVSPPEASGTNIIFFVPGL